MKKILLSLLLCVICGVAVYFATRNCNEKCNNASRNVSQEVVPEIRVREMTDQLNNITDVRGNKKGLGEADGRYRLVTFWNLKDSCYIESMSDFQELYVKNDSLRTQMLSVFFYDRSETGSVEKAAKWYSESKFTFPMYALPIDDAGFRALDITPETSLLLVNPKGRIIFRTSVKGYKVRLESDMSRLTSSNSR